MPNRLLDYLAPLGAIVIVAAFGWTRTGRSLPGELRWYVVAGLALVVAHLLLRWDEVAGSIGARQLRYGGNAAVLTLVVLGILTGINYLAFRHNQRADLTENRRHSLSDQTRKVVRGLTEEVTITYFARAQELRFGQQRLEEYEALSNRLRVSFVDPVSDPVKAQSYDVRPPWPVLFVERGDKRERITNDSEQDLTNALIKIFRDEIKQVCFARGEGQRDPEDFGELGFSAVRDALQESQYQTQKVALLIEKSVPSECTVVVLAGPQNDLLPPAIDALRAFVSQGGSLLAMVEPPFEQPFTNLEALLGEWGIDTGPDVVLDFSGVGQLFGTGALTPIALQYPYHEITKDFRVMTALTTARRVEAAAEPPQGVVAQNLIETSENAWAETDLTLTEPIEPNEAVDQMGPISMGAVATVRISEPEAAVESAGVEPDGDAEPSGDAGIVDPDAEVEATEQEPEAPKPREGRVVAFGDSDFASNGYLGFQGNRDLFLNSVAWLAEDADLISIRPREPQDQRLFLDRIDQGNVTLVALLLIPGFFLVVGVMTWWRRR